jgi:hypothetical protein
MEVMTTAFMPVYIHKVVDRRIEIRYDSNGQQIRILTETLVEEFNPVLIATLQQRILDLETKLRTTGTNREGLSQEATAAYVGILSVIISDVVKKMLY